MPAKRRRRADGLALGPRPSDRIWASLWTIAPHRHLYHGRGRSCLGAFLLDPAAEGKGIYLAAWLLPVTDLACTTTEPTVGTEDGFGDT